MYYDTHQELLKLVESYPQGIAMGELESLYLDSVNRRTIQRWLNVLIDGGKVIRLGKGRGTRYVSSNLVQEPTYSEQTSSSIPLSIEAKKLEQYIQQPLIRRKPVGYQAQFLTSYIPNKSFYLSEEQRSQLHSYGQILNKDDPAGTFARKIADRLLIDLSWNSSRLEGNTYSLLETERLISAGMASESKNSVETQMILNHKDAIEFLIDAESDVGINRYTFLNLHAMLADNLLADQSACGRLRTIAVGISQTTFLPLDNPQLLQEYFEQVLVTAEAIHDPFEQAFFLLVHLPYLQPFEDVNKRVSRLAASIPLIKHNLCPISFIDVPKSLYISGILAVYELNRVDLLRDLFIWAYKRSCERYSAVRQTIGEPDPFRLKHKELLFSAINQVVKQTMNKTQAINYIQEFAKQKIESEYQFQLIEMIESELLSLHEGNFARYKVTPREFKRWQELW